MLNLSEDVLPAYVAGDGGTLIVRGGQAAGTMFLSFKNTGSVHVESGVLSLAGGGDATGEVTISGGAELDLGGTHNFSPASGITGAGDLSVIGGTANLAGMVSVSGIHTFSFGTANITGTYSCLGNALNITGGTANFNGTGTIAPVTLTVDGFGVLGGSNLVTVSGPMSWGGSSSIIGGNSIIANGGLSISGNVFLSGRTLINTGTAIWTNSVINSLTLSDGAVVSNAPGALFECAIDSFLYSGGGTNAFINAGLFRKTGGGGTTLISVPFYNAGVIEGQSGRLNFVGPLTIQPGGSIRLNGGTVTNTLPMQLAGGALQGNGLVSGAVLNQGRVSPGASPGQLLIAGDYAQAANGALNIELAATNGGLDFDRLIISNNASLDGTLNVSLYTGYYPAPNSSFTFLTAAQIAGAFAAFNYPSNDIALALTYSASNVTLRVLNTRPSIELIPDQLVSNQAPFRLAIHASDADVPAQTLTSGLLTAPPGARMDTNGVITWTPNFALLPVTTRFTVLVSDNGSPPLVAEQTFQVTVGQPGMNSIRLFQPGGPELRSSTLTFAGIPVRGSIRHQPLGSMV